MWWTTAKTAIAVVTILAVASVSQRWPRLGALLLTLPLISILAFIFLWTDQHRIGTISQLARETLILVPLGLPFFVPLAVADRYRLGFWTAFFLGVLFASVTIGCWLFVAPRIFCDKTG
jgi:hypothetical protein